LYGHVAPFLGLKQPPNPAIQAGRHPQRSLRRVLLGGSRTTSNPSTLPMWAVMAERQTTLKRHTEFAKPPVTAALLGGSRSTGRGLVLAAVAFATGRVALAGWLRNMYDRALAVVSHTTGKRGAEFGYLLTDLLRAVVALVVALAVVCAPVAPRLRVNHLEQVPC
jgi:hypothetical protein